MKLSDFLDADEKSVTNGASDTEHSTSRWENISHNGEGPFDKLDKIADWDDIFIYGANYTKLDRPPDSKTMVAYKRPGAESDYSVKILKDNPHVVVVHSDMCGLPTGGKQKLTMGRVCAIWHHNGDERAAATAMLQGTATYLPLHVQDAIRTKWGDRDATISLDTGEQIDTAIGEVLKPREHTGLTLPTSFYESRPELKEIREYAHRWGAPADPVLYAILARISATVPPGQRVQTGIMSPKGASLNLFVAAIGPSGSCKSSSASIAKSYFQPGVLDMLDGIGLGSGEGLAEAYMGWIEINTGEFHNNGNPKTKKVRQQTRENVYIVVDEGESLTRQMERNGATVGPMLRSAADGKTLGQANAEEARNRHVDEGCYSMGILMGFQPETAAPLLRDSASGTTQRFVYCFTTAADIPIQPPEQPKAVMRCAKLIAQRTQEGKVTTMSGRGGASQCLASRDRQWFEEAMEYAVSVLWIKVDGDQVMPGDAVAK